MDACENAPPANVSIKPSIPFLELAIEAWIPSGSIPGRTICAPTRYININAKVKRILLRNSSILQIFFSVFINFFTDAERFKDRNTKKTHLTCAVASYGKSSKNFYCASGSFDRSFCFLTYGIYFKSKLALNFAVSKNLHFIILADQFIAVKILY